MFFTIYFIYLCNIKQRKSINMELKFRDLDHEIVFVKKDEVFTDTRTIANEFDKRHDNILRLTEQCIEEMQSIENYEDSTLLTFEERKFRTQQGNEYVYYEMNRSAFMYFMMKMKGDKANIYKIRFIKAFNAMEQWIKDRAVGRGVRLSMTDSIKDYIPESPNKKFKYKHFTDLVYKKVLGKTKKQIETELGRSIENLREICTDDQLNQFTNYENEISILLKYNNDYEAIKGMIK